MVSTATAAQTLNAEAFNQLVLERGLQTWRVGEYRHAGYRGPNGWELYRTQSIESLEECTEQTAVTSNPAAGTISVDVKTFTGRGRVSAVAFTCVMDATVITRYLDVQKVSGANTITLARSVGTAASGTGTMQAVVGFTALFAATAYPALGQVDFAPGDILRVVVQGGQAGDDMSAITYSYKETD